MGRMGIADYLPDRKADAVPVSKLSKMTGLKPRKIRSAVRAEGRQGVPILSETRKHINGMWVWNGEDINELRQYARHVERTAKDMLKTLKPIKKILREYDRGN